MNTKTMRLPPRRVVTSSTNKGKEREGSDSLKPLTPNTPHPYPHLHHPPPPPLPSPLPSKSPKPTTAQPGSDKPLKPNAPSNQLLAGYLAHEFLSKGTLFGQPWEPARAEPSSEPKRAKPSQKPELSGKSEDENHRRYMEVSRLLRADGAHVPGIVNPTQLARFLKM